MSYKDMSDDEIRRGRMTNTAPFTTSPHHWRNVQAKITKAQKAIRIMQIYLEAMKKSVEFPLLGLVFFEQARVESMAVAGCTCAMDGGELHSGELYIVGENQAPTIDFNSLQKGGKVTSGRLYIAPENESIALITLQQKPR